jgi:sialic acid synthase SpsE
MPKDFRDTPYAGYSDHALGISAALLAISRGARIVEKHFTLDKSDTTIRDHALSATPEEFRLLVNLGRELGAHVAGGV